MRNALSVETVCEFLQVRLFSPVECIVEPLSRRAPLGDEILDFLEGSIISSGGET